MKVRVLPLILTCAITKGCFVMKFLALEHHLQLQPRLIVLENPLAASRWNIFVASEGYRASLSLVKSTHFLIKMRFEGTSTSLFLGGFFVLFLFCCLTNIFLFYRFYRETDRRSLYVYVYFTSVLFLFQMQRKHLKPDKQSRHRVYTQQYDSTTEWLYILVAFRLLTYTRRNDFAILTIRN